MLLKSTLALVAAAAFAVGPAVSPARAAPAPRIAIHALFLARKDIVRGSSTDVWKLSLRAGVHYVIRVDGDGDSDLDAYLYDENGNLIDSDDDSTDLCILDVTPLWIGPFTLRIVNRGSVANLYSLTVR
jgi:hypothetical protein